MLRPTFALLALSLVLAGCGGFRDSRVNPMNWFGGSTEESALGPLTLENDNRVLVGSVSSLAIERTSTGALVRAEAQMPGIGWWDVELVPENEGRPVDGVLSYRFLAAAPRNREARAAGGSQTLVAAAPVSEFTLEQVSTIVVRGAESSRSVRR
ncbi:MAG: hypothetical protein HLUCCA12_02130 [Rhodobacteraceae bacterium HLUCCA12]|nr:MAG: hypothetical protein HLUCCA12_02130 [Rhodobacteraceae bacterium HLUCCA12]